MKDLRAVVAECCATSLHGAPGLMRQSVDEQERLGALLQACSIANP